VNPSSNPFSNPFSNQNEILDEILEARALRTSARAGTFTAPTAGHAPGKVQCNMVALPQKYAFDFLLFAQRNPKAMPLVEVLEAGQYESRYAAQSDVRRDVPLYHVFRDGVRSEHVQDARALWQNDFVTFLIGCSFTFEAMTRANLEVRHVNEKRNVPMYRTTRQTQAAGVFSGPLVVSMRPLPAADVAKTAALTARFPMAHGAPVHMGDPLALGIESLERPDFGDAVTVYPNELPIFWACGVTPQLALERAGIPLAITHAPGHMLVLDVGDDELALERI
jgi:uncharacterized protein YcsI (UPF0317 family)